MSLCLSECLSECLSVLEQSWNYSLYVSVPVHSLYYVMFRQCDILLLYNTVWYVMSVPVHSLSYVLFCQCDILHLISVHLYCKPVFCTLLQWTGFLYTCTINRFSVHLHCKLALCILYHNYWKIINFRFRITLIYKSEQLTRTFAVLVFYHIKVYIHNPLSKCLSVNSTVCSIPRRWMWKLWMWCNWHL